MKSVLLVAILIGAAAAGVDAQRRGTGGNVTFAVAVSDPDGKPLPGVAVVVEGPANRTVRTEGGRIAIEGLPSGTYRLRFEKEGFVPLEREIVARGAAPIDVRVTLTPIPAPPPPPAAPVAPPKPVVKANSVVVDVPAWLEKNYVGRGPSKVTRLSCGTDGETAVLQLTAPIPNEEHANYDETFYVVAGEGVTAIAEKAQMLKAGMFIFIPRGTPHRLAPTGKNPLILLTTRGGGC